MNGAFYIGATAIEAHQRAVDALAANIANANTTAYKRLEVQFSELLQAPAPVNGDGAGSHAIADMSLGGVQVQAGIRTFDQGPLNPTGKPFDVAINGDGFFEVLGPSGQFMLWRGGTLVVNGDGYLAAANGYSLKQLIRVPDNAQQLQIDADGKVWAVLGSAANPTQLGQIGLAHVRDNSALASLGGGLFSDTSAAEGSGSTNVISLAAGQDGAGTIVQGSLETSNVSLTVEMTSLMLVQRIYAANAQVVQAADQLMGIANGLRRA